MSRFGSDKPEKSPPRGKSNQFVKAALKGSRYTSEEE